MKNKKTIIIIQAILTLSIHSVLAQEVQYSYDPSGNRTERNMILLPPENPGSDQQTEEQEYKLEEQEPEFSEMLNKHEITIFPNPNGGKFDVQITNLAEVKEFSIMLYTMDGKEVYSGNKPSELTL